MKRKNSWRSFGTGGTGTLSSSRSSSSPSTKIISRLVFFNDDCCLCCFGGFHFPSIDISVFSSIPCPKIQIKSPNLNFYFFSPFFGFSIKTEIKRNKKIKNLRGPCSDFRLHQAPLPFFLQWNFIYFLSDEYMYI